MISSIACAAFASNKLGKKERKKERHGLYKDILLQFVKRLKIEAYKKTQIHFDE